jgi:hypothetical protein
MKQHPNREKKKIPQANTRKLNVFHQLQGMQFASVPRKKKKKTKTTTRE